MINFLSSFSKKKKTDEQILVKQIEEQKKVIEKFKKENYYPTELGCYAPGTRDIPTWQRTWANQSAELARLEAELSRLQQLLSNC